MLSPQRLDDTDTAALCDRAQDVDPQVRARVQAIIADVAADGDAALRRLTKELDGCDLDDPMLPNEEWNALADRCPTDVQQAIRGNLARITAFHERQRRSDDVVDVEPGVRLGRRAVPHRVVACYVPGGRASYPSTVLMTVPLARIAGVERIVVVTPPREDGSIDPAVAFAARIAGATDILRAGGAQAVAAVAYGTDRVPRTDAIVGPGNAYVTEAKRILSDRLAIDSPAGPSELLVLADATADPVFVAADLVAQAEHDPDAVCLLVTDSQELADAVADGLEAQAEAAERTEIIRAALSDHGAILVADSFEDAIAFADDFAAEHLEVMCKDAAQVAARIRHAGSIFIGPHAPVPLGDYGSGTNHVLPTMGYAHMRGGLSVDDFQKWITWQEVTPDGLAAIADDIITLADAEGLHAHADAVRRRLEATR